MARVKRSKIAMKHRRNVLKRAKGYQFGRSKKEVEAKVALRKAGAHAFAHRKDKKFSKIVVQDANKFYGKSYQDIQTRVPSIKKAKEILGWSPKVTLDDALKRTLNAFLEEL